MSEGRSQLAVGLFFFNHLQVLYDVGNSCLIKQTSFDYKLHQDLRVKPQNLHNETDRREKARKKDR